MANSQLQRKNVPSAFCANFCCAFIATECRAVNVDQKTCLWTAQAASLSIKSFAGKSKNVTREVQKWGMTLGNTPNV